MTRAEMEAIAGMSTEEYSRWLIGSQHAMFRAAALRRPDVPRSVQEAHDLQRHEPPAPYDRALAKRGVVPQAATAPVVDADGTPLPYTTALRARKEER